MLLHEKITYIEFPSKNLDLTKKFFSEVFGWTFQDYSAEYTAFSNAGILGGFYLSEKTCESGQGSALAVLYSQNLESTQVKIEMQGGKVTKPTFSFPGGRRFHFRDPNGNEYAVWSDKAV